MSVEEVALDFTTVLDFHGQGRKKIGHNHLLAIIVILFNKIISHVIIFIYY